MHSIIAILMKSALIFSVLYLLYYVMFSRTTFHKTNRIVLLFILPVSVLLPLIEINADSVNISNTVGNFELGTFDGYIAESTTTAIGLGEESNGIQLLTLIYFGVVALLSFRALYQFAKLFFLIKTQGVIRKQSYKLVLLGQNLAPFSFFSWIFISSKDFNSAYGNKIVLHEQTHAKQLHSVDIILAEMLSIYLWFVPFVYLYKRSLKQVHEYLADREVVDNQTGLVDYLKALTTNASHYTMGSIGHQFYYKPLKQRIIMITKKQSSPWYALRYLVLLPIVVLLLQAFSLQKSEIMTLGNENASFVKDAESPAFVLPIARANYEISSNYGMRVHPITKKKILHKGIDLKANTGTEVLSVEAGKVIQLEFQENAYGKIIAIEHANGYVSVYAQLSAFKTTLGSEVSKGQLIGLVGSSGMSTGPHLHFELHKDNKPLDPALHIAFK